jgi:hypothetical protein
MKTNKAKELSLLIANILVIITLPPHHTKAHHAKQLQLRTHGERSFSLTRKNASPHNQNFIFHKLFASIIRNGIR